MHALRFVGNGEYIGVVEFMVALHDRNEELRPLMVAWAQGPTPEPSKDAETLGGAANESAAPSLAASHLQDAIQRLEQSSEAEKKAFTSKALAALRSWLMEDRERTRKHFERWDRDGSAHISEPEMRGALRTMGLEVPKEVVLAVFDDIDQDGNYKITFQELNTWMAGVAARKEWGLTRSRTRVLPIGANFGAISQCSGPGSEISTEVSESQAKANTMEVKADSGDDRDWGEWRSSFERRKEALSES